MSGKLQAERCRVYPHFVEGDIDLELRRFHKLARIELGLYLLQELLGFLDILRQDVRMATRTERAFVFIALHVARYHLLVDEQERKRLADGINAVGEYFVQRRRDTFQPVHHTVRARVCVCARALCAVERVRQIYHGEVDERKNRFFFYAVSLEDFAF